MRNKHVQRMSFLLILVSAIGCGTPPPPPTDQNTPEELLQKIWSSATAGDADLYAQCYVAGKEAKQVLRELAEFICVVHEWQAVLEARFGADAWDAYVAVDVTPSFQPSVPSRGTPPPKWVIDHGEDKVMIIDPVLKLPLEIKQIDAVWYACLPDEAMPNWNRAGLKKLISTVRRALVYSKTATSIEAVKRQAGIYVTE